MITNKKIYMKETACALFLRAGIQNLPEETDHSELKKARNLKKPIKQSIDQIRNRRERRLRYLIRGTGRSIGEEGGKVRSLVLVKVITVAAKSRITIISGAMHFKERKVVLMEFPESRGELSSRDGRTVFLNYGMVTSPR